MNPRPGHYVDCPTCGYPHFVQRSSTPPASAQFTREELTGPNADMEAHSAGRCSDACLFCLAAAHTENRCGPHCRWCVAQFARPKLLGHPSPKGCDKASHGPENFPAATPAAIAQAVTA